MESTQSTTTDENTECPVMYFVVNSDLKMKPGKVAAQCCHAAIQIYEKMPKDLLYQEWLHTGTTKIVLIATENQMIDLHRKYSNISVKVIDAGRTQILPNSFTVLGFYVSRKSRIPELQDLKLHK